MSTKTVRSTMRVAVTRAAFLLTVCLPGFVFADAVPRPVPGGEMIQMIQDKDKIKILKDEKARPVIENEQKKPSKSSGSSDKKLLVKQFEIRGNSLLEPEEIKSVTSQLEGKELTIDDIWNVADLITSKYRESGYLLVNAYVPPQKIVDGVVIIMIMEGKIGTISVDGNKSYSSAFIERNLANTLNDVSVKDETIERDLLILNDYLSLNVKASLRAGKEPGTTDIVVGTTDKFPISGSISYDNYGIDTTSKNRLNVSLNLGNLLSSGDLLMLRGVTGLDRIDVTRLSFGRAEYLIPVGGYGTQVGGYFANSIYHAGQELASLDMHGRAIVAGLYATHPVVRKRDETLSIRIGGEYIDATGTIASSDLFSTKDNIRKLVVNLPYTMTDRYLGRNYLSLGYAVGLGDTLNGTKGNGADSTNPSRSNASNSFGKLNLDAMRIQKLPGYNHLIIRGGGQYSPDNLLIEEQYIVGGPGSVRGYNPAQAAGDSGYFVSAELAVSPIAPEKTIFRQKVGETFKLALFFDHGGVFNNEPLNERKSQYLSSFGAGVRVYGGQFFTFKLDCAVPKVSGNYKMSNRMITLEADLSF